MFAKRRLPSPALMLAFVAVFLVGGGTAVAGSVINGSKIKKKSIPLSALSPSAIKSLKGGVGPAGPAGAAGAAGANGASAAKYWAFITDAGGVGRSSGGVNSSFSTNGGVNKQYRVSFPTDISQCSYQVTSGDTTPVGASEYAVGYLPAVTRSNIDVNTVAVTLWNSAGGGTYGNQFQDSFHIAVFC
jgi:hypothetical protein